LIWWLRCLLATRSCLSLLRRLVARCRSWLLGSFSFPFVFKIFNISRILYGQVALANLLIECILFTNVPDTVNLSQEVKELVRSHGKIIVMLIYFEVIFELRVEVLNHLWLVFWKVTFAFFVVLFSFALEFFNLLLDIIGFDCLIFILNLLIVLSIAVSSTKSTNFFTNVHWNFL
jgi:hypothetical protein